MIVKEVSKTAVIITAIYLLLAVFAFFVMFSAKQDESLAAIFAVIVAMPWTIVLTKVVDTFSIDSEWFNTVFLMCGTVLNALFLFLFTSWITRCRS